MLTNIFSLFSHSSSQQGYTKHAPTPRYRPSPAEDHFALLASLQIAVLAPPPAPTTPSTAPSMLHGHNPANLRKQGCLALTFALKNHTAGAAPEKIRVANALEEAIDAAWAGVEDYRGRVYAVGGWLAENDGIIDRVLSGELTVEDIAAGKLPVPAAAGGEKVVAAYC